MDWNTIVAFVQSIPIDWIVLGGLVVLFSFDALRNGAGRVQALCLALPCAMLLFSIIPSAAFIGDFIPQFSTPLLQAVLFFILATGFFLLVRRMDGGRGGGYGQPLQAVLAGIAGVAVLTVVWIQVPMLDAVWHLGDDLRLVFGGMYAFWWLISSYTALAFIRD
jgi:hypothetical protein